MFNLVGVLTILKYYKLEVETLDYIIIMVKKWPQDIHLNFL
jgi:hypothetical protein